MSSMRGRTWSYLQLTPLVLVLLVFVAALLVFVVIVSFLKTDGFDAIPAFALENFQAILSRALGRRITRISVSAG